MEESSLQKEVTENMRHLISWVLDIDASNKSDAVVNVVFANLHDPQLAREIMQNTD